MKLITVQNAIVTLLLASGLAVAVQPAAADTIAVIHIKAIDGLHVPGASIQTNRDNRFIVGSRVRVSRSAISTLDGVKTLVLIDRRSDAKTNEGVVETYTSDVMALNGDTFMVKDLAGKNISYAIDELSDGSLDVVGPKDLIVARPNGVFKIWKIESARLMDRSRVTLF